MEFSTAASRYQYSLLPRDKTLHFRTFTLSPADDLSATIQGALRISSISTSDIERNIYEKYEALSYAWGDPALTGSIEFPDKSSLSMAANLDCFLRHRRQSKKPVVLWIDAICINQRDNKEKSSQVQAMGQIYTLASSLSIWLGPPSEDSTLALSALEEYSYGLAFSKLSIASEESVAIDRLLKRAWWFRAWVIQEVALGGAGIKYNRMTVWCGLECIKWVQLVLACSWMYSNALNMRQSFPAVENVLKLDTLPSRSEDEVLGTAESYPGRLLNQLSKHRNCSASDHKDKIYGLLGLWADTTNVGTQSGVLPSAAPTVNCDRSVEDIYIDYAYWIIIGMQSLELLHHCQPQNFDSPMVGSLPTWVPDWSQPLTQARLPCSHTIERASIPWWSLPVRSDLNEQHVSYRRESYPIRRQRAEKILRPLRSTLHFIPEWVVDLADPDRTKGYESLFKKLQDRPDAIFVFPDESDRALGNDEEDLNVALKRTQDHNERRLQKQVLSQYLDSDSLPRTRTHYKACADTTCEVGLTGKRMHVRGILADTIKEVFDAFPEEIERNWTSSSRLMVQIGKCKQAAMDERMEKTPYLTELTRATAFWKTLFAGQKASDENKIVSWLPLVPTDWKPTAPSLTVLESARLEYAEIQTMVDAHAEHLTSMATDGSIYMNTGSEEHLAQDNKMLDAHWSSSDRLEYSRTFETLGNEWAGQPYDLYHRPFSVPHVVPDPFWAFRSVHDGAALRASID